MFFKIIFYLFRISFTVSVHFRDRVMEQIYAF